VPSREKKSEKGEKIKVWKKKQARNGEKKRKSCVFQERTNFHACHKSAPDGRKGRAESGERRENENYRQRPGPKKQA